MTADTNPVVGIIMGSNSDWPIMKNAADTLEKLGIPHEAKVMSAHRTPDRVEAWSRSARDRGIKVVIAAAGMSAALPGVIAAQTTLPVLGVPMENAKVASLDAVFSILQMPAGIPVGALAVGRAGAVNSALLAAAILGLSDDRVSKAIDDFRAEQSAAIQEDPSL
ncbi:MAG: 5-(carboxyamino)imidazole ribonucleotide mutase [Alphaproteobacteria bacterium]|mgnify:FL=1|jgi:5-(carboxyamino)imidazole ribonucleotide mutase|nr:5-(carboxyamino)imidazole ribonucleotide mutase [Alphaproteobacteria bacterium]MBT4020002.1 5-(carboxyamino)imidazole ribonucleotide mutase [Alphaproteobacteria bacterium]MBT5161337.1 5-(carboxyamino)imidazole ribonucleotide mutase [Alphaproteobacteria bacterium]MBT5918368.1 5-(carboxyamino)imidazole ribonucleotide mutase [Alphaproteobacteria bacterium]MBT6387491.1 5-(carboxyamino)imidazole ribonucleotide mutase [Alphaproteobacteria bacterium]